MPTPYSDHDSTININVDTENIRDFYANDTTWSNFEDEIVFNITMDDEPGNYPALVTLDDGESSRAYTLFVIILPADQP